MLRSVGARRTDVARGVRAEELRDVGASRSMNMTTLIIATRNAHKVEEIRGILGPRFQFLTLGDFPNAPTVIEDANTFAGNATKKAVELARWLQSFIGTHSCIKAENAGTQTSLSPQRGKGMRVRGGGGQSAPLKKEIVPIAVTTPLPVEGRGRGVAASPSDADRPENLLPSVLRFPAYVLADDSGLEVDALNCAPGVHSARFAALDGGAAGNSSDAENNAKLLRLLQNVPMEKRSARFRCIIALTPLLPPHSVSTSPVCAADEHELQMEVFDGVCEGRITFAPSGAKGFGYDPLFVPNGFEQSFAELGEEVKNRISHRAKALEKLRTRFAGSLQSRDAVP